MYTMTLAFSPIFTLIAGIDTNDIKFNIGDAAVEQGIPGAALGWQTMPGMAFGQLISQVLMIALTVGAIAVFGYLLWGALDWLTSAGDKSKTEKARDKITQAVVGLILIISTAAIMLFVQQLLGICIIDFGGSQCKNKPVSCTCLQTTAECGARGGSSGSGACSAGLTCCYLPPQGAH